MEPEAAIPIRINLLGNLRLTVGTEIVLDITTNRMRSLLAYLVLHAGTLQSREQIASLLWPESNQAQARTNLRQLLHHLRRALPLAASLVESDNTFVRWLAVDSCTIDVFEFEKAARLAEQSLPEIMSSRLALEEAIRLYQDDLLPDLYDEWLISRREDLRTQFANVLVRLRDLLDTIGDIPEAIRLGTRLVGLDSLREDYYQALLRLHIRNHDRSSALRVYHQCKRSLQRELGISPSSETQKLFTEALRSAEHEKAEASLSSTSTTVKPRPLVGRRVEWDILADRWRRVTEEGAHFILICGEPGIGKTRLAVEFLENCSRIPNNSVARAHCYQVHGESAYGPVVEWLRAEPLSSIRSKLSNSQLTELVRLLPEILTDNPSLHVPQPLPDSLQRHYLHEALTSTFRLVPTPLLLLLDDVQWCDQDSCEWLRFFFRSLPADRLLVIGTLRVGEAGRDHPLTGLIHELDSRGQLSQIVMEPLDPTDTGVLASEIAGYEIEQDSLSRLYRTTKGNPLFVVESVRASVVDQLAEGEIPPRLQTVISARFAHLSASAYELVGLMAAVGRSFTMDFIASATDWDEESLTRACEELWRCRIIDGQQGGDFDFTHALLRDVAYAEQNPVRRRLLHRRIARTLSEVYREDSEPLSGWLAGHYEAAGMVEEAIRCYQAAADAAKRNFFEGEAVIMVRRAIALTLALPESNRRDQDELKLLLSLGQSLVQTNGYSMPEVGETYARGLALAKQHEDRTHLFSLLSGSWLFHLVRGQVTESRRLAQECIDAAHREGSAKQEEASHFLLGTSLFHLGDFEASLQEIGLTGFPPGELPHPALALFAGPHIDVFRSAYLSHLLCIFDRYDEASAKSLESIAAARSVSQPFTIAIALYYAAVLHVYSCSPAMTLELASEASAICKKFGFVYYQYVSEIVAGWAAAIAGNASTGLAQMRAGLDSMKSIHAEIRLPFYYGLLAEAYGGAGRMNDALANVSIAFAFLNKNSEAWAAPELHRIHGDLLAQSGNHVGSRASYSQAIKHSQNLGARLFERRAISHLAALPG